MATIIAPSILSADFAHLADEVKKVVDAGAEYVHVDVMDGTFVPEITIGAGVVKSLRKFTDAVLDVHLMVEHPETQLESFAKSRHVTFRYRRVNRRCRHGAGYDGQSRLRRAEIY